MNWKCSGAAVIVLLSLFTFHAQPTTAQSAAISAAKTMPASLAPMPAPALPPGAPLPGHSTIVVQVVNEAGAPLAQQAVVQLWSVGATPVYAVTQPAAEVKFDGLQACHYTIAAAAAGYEASQSSLDTFANDTFYQEVITLKP
jgi:hypothetical protein